MVEWNGRCHCSRCSATPNGMPEAPGVPGPVRIASCASVAPAAPVHFGFGAKPTLTTRNTPLNDGAAEGSWFCCVVDAAFRPDLPLPLDANPAFRGCTPIARMVQTQTERYSGESFSPSPPTVSDHGGHVRARPGAEFHRSRDPSDDGSHRSRKLHCTCHSIRNVSTVSVRRGRESHPSTGAISVGRLASSRCSL
jgi:hypothetical protein